MNANQPLPPPPTFFTPLPPAAGFMPPPAGATQANQIRWNRLVVLIHNGTSTVQQLSAQRASLRGRHNQNQNFNLGQYIRNLEQAAVNHWNANNPFTPTGQRARITSTRTLNDNLAPNAAGRYQAQLNAIAQQAVLAAGVQFQPAMAPGPAPAPPHPPTGVAAPPAVHQAQTGGLVNVQQQQQQSEDENDDDDDDDDDDGIEEDDVEEEDSGVE